MVCLGKYHFKLFKGCLPQILVGPFLNTLTHLFISRNFSLKHFEVTIHFYEKTPASFCIQK